MMSVEDWLALAVFLGCYLGYPRYYRWVRRRGQVRLRYHLLDELIQGACDNANTPEGRMLLSGQLQVYARTLIFLAGVNLLILGGALGLFMNSDQLNELSMLSVFSRLADPVDMRLRLTIFILLAGYAFLQFVWGLKALYNLTHAVHLHDPEIVKTYLRHLDVDFNNGLRTLYYLSILFLWFFGPEFLIAGSVVFTILIYRFDFLKTKD